MHQRKMSVTEYVQNNCKAIDPNSFFKSMKKMKKGKRKRNLFDASCSQASRRYIVNILWSTTLCIVNMTTYCLLGMLYMSTWRQHMSTSCNMILYLWNLYFRSLWLGYEQSWPSNLAHVILFILVMVFKVWN